VAPGSTEGPAAGRAAEALGAAAGGVRREGAPAPNASCRFGHFGSIP